MPLCDLRVEPFEETQLLHFPPFEQIPGFSHAVTTRPWNMAMHRGPEAERAVGRRRRICMHLGLSFDRLTAADQVHSPHVIRVRPHDAGGGRDNRATAMRFVDGLVCDLPDTPLIQFSADCPLLLVVEPERRVFGMAHASWRGTVTSIATELIRQLRMEYGIEPEKLVAGVCPCAGPGEYEVGEDVYRIARARLGDVDAFFPRRGGTLYFDMRAANVAQLVEAGVRREDIHVAVCSTLTDARFYSHRRDGADTGRFALIAGFRDRA